MVSTRSTPEASSRVAISLAVIGSRGADFLSCREYPYQGMTAVMRCAEASLAALIITSSSIRLSLTGRLVDCTRNTSAPRTLSSKRT